MVFNIPDRWKTTTIDYAPRGKELKPKKIRKSRKLEQHRTSARWTFDDPKIDKEC